MTITELAQAARNEAVEVVNRHQKMASLQLYRILALTLGVAEACRISPANDKELRLLVASEVPPGMKRAYVEHRSDEFILACRYVLAGEDPANISRYSHALREAKKIQLTSESLFAWLKNNGGVNALYLRRPSAHEQINAKLIRFDQSVTLPKSGRFTLTLERRMDGVFSVIEVQ